MIFLGASYIVYFAYRLAFSPLTEANDLDFRSSSLLDGLLLNCFNPKAYAVLLLLYSQFHLTTEREWISQSLTGLVIFIVVCIVNIGWLFLGVQLKPVFIHPKKGRWIRVVFAVAIVAILSIALLFI